MEEEGDGKNVLNFQTDFVGIVVSLRFLATERHIRSLVIVCLI